MAMSDLPRDLLKEILSRVPVESIRAVRSTCKDWNTLFHNRVFIEKLFCKKLATKERTFIVQPMDLQFPFELKKQISCFLYLTNMTDNNVAFKVKTTNLKNYCVRPNNGLILPMSTFQVRVTMQALKEAPSHMQCKDKFLIQGVIVSPGVTAKEVTSKMFSKEAGHLVEETKVGVTYVAPPRPPSLFQRHIAGKAESQENTSEERAFITKLIEEKHSVIQLNNRLQRELDLLRRDSKMSQSGGIPFMYVLLVGLIGLILGYIL